MEGPGAGEEVAALGLLEAALLFAGFGVGLSTSLLIAGEEVSGVLGDGGTSLGAGAGAGGVGGAGDGTGGGAGGWIMPEFAGGGV